MPDKDKKHLETFLSASTESLGGALVGSGFGAGFGFLLSPSDLSQGVTIIGTSIVIGSAIGSGLGGLVGLSVSGVMEVFSGSPRKLIRDKLKEDFDNSYLHDTLSAIAGLREAGAIIEEVNAAKRAKQTKVMSDKRFVCESPTIRAEFLSSEEILNNLRKLKRYKTLRINVSAISSGAVAVLKSLAEKYGDSELYPEDMLKIELDYTPTNGREQVTLVKEGELFDFIIVPNDPFYYMEDEKCAAYPLNICCFGQRQFLFFGKGKSLGKAKLIHVYGESSANLHWEHGKGIPKNAKEEIFESAKNIALLKEMAQGDLGVIVWEPLSRIFERSKKWERVSHSEHYIYFCLRSHKKWMSKSREKARKAFQALFVNEWRYCKRNSGRAYRLLVEDQEYVEKFTIGAGLRDLM